MKLLRFLVKTFILGITLAALLCAAGAAYSAYRYEKQSALDEAVIIQIPHGSNIRVISEILTQQGILREDRFDGVIFQLNGRLTGQANMLKAGEYEIPPHASMLEIMDLLESGKVVQRQVTIREGLTSFEIKTLLLAQNDLDHATEFAMKGEGRYLPETYSYQKGEDASAVLGRMEQAMDRVLDAAWAKRAADLPLKTKEEALVLASIIEKETAVASERKRVAGVFINRLRRGMLLQTDPSVIYALMLGENKNDGQGPLGRRLLKKDLAYDSPYNTYLYAGLPPGPIANPGQASIEAALNPETHDYLYFVADGSGGHAFAKSLNEHNNNVAQWRKIRKAQ